MDEQNNVVTPAPQGNDGLAIKIVSLVLGVASISSIGWGLGAFVGLGCAIAALILGIKGRKQGGKLVPMATAGMICGIVGIVFSVIGIICGICTCALASAADEISKGLSNIDDADVNAAINSLFQ